jgi:hypothetical protein
MVTKWVRQLSAECKLPDWIKGTLREIVLFELMRSYFHHPFNRYVWVVLWDRDGPKMEYFSAEVRVLGLALSLVAKLVINSKNTLFWERNDEVLVSGLFKMAMETTEATLQGWVKLQEEDLRKRMEGRLEGYFKQVRAEASEMLEAAKLKARWEERMQYKSAQFVEPGDLDLEDEVDEELEELGADANAEEEVVNLDEGRDESDAFDPPPSNQEGE